MHTNRRPSMSSAVSARRTSPVFATLAAAIALGLGAQAHAATFTVTTLDDLAEGSLREAIKAANATIELDEIVFAPGLEGTIAFETAIDIREAVHIVGPGAGTIVLDGGENVRLFSVNPSFHEDWRTIPVTIEGLTLQNGFAGDNGGCIRAYATALELIDSTVSGCVAGEGEGGGIFIAGFDPAKNGNAARADGRRRAKAAKGFTLGAASLVLRNTRIENNSALSYGGGISAPIFSDETAGDGIRILEGSVISGNQVTGSNDGGGIDVYADSPFDIEIRDSQISDNITAGDAGGGLSVWHEGSGESRIVIAGSTFRGNQVNMADTPGPIHRGGGGMALFTGATVEIDGSTIENNAVTLVEPEQPPSGKGSNGNNAGGGVLILPPNSLQETLSPTLVVTDSRFAGNTAMAGGGVAFGSGQVSGPPQKTAPFGVRVGREHEAVAGKGLPPPATWLRIEDTQFENNTAEGGAAVYSLIAPQSSGPQPVKGIATVHGAVLERVTATGNTATGAPSVDGDGAALLVSAVEQSILLLNSTVSGNSGGGVGFSPYGTDEGIELLVIESSTIVANTGSGVGVIFPPGAPQLDGKAYPQQQRPIAIRNSIVHGNTGGKDEPRDIALPGEALHLLHNLVGISENDVAGYDDGGGNQFGVEDALLGELADNGGTTHTHLPLAGSPAIDAGDPDFATPPDNDQRGEPRVIGDALDIGAVETLAILPGTLQFDPASVTVDETAGTVTLTVVRIDGEDGDVGIVYASADDTATADEDYTAASGTLTWLDGDSAPKTITVSIIDDTLIEADERFDVSLSEPTGGATVGEADTATVTIVSDDVMALGEFSFSSPVYSIDENGGAATITVTRSGGTGTAESVSYATGNGTAMAGSDYTATSGTLSFAIGDVQATFTVPVVDDSVVEGDETVNLTLSDASDGAILGDVPTAVLTIVDDDVAAPGALGFDPVSYTVDEGAGSATLQVRRSGGSDGEVTIDYGSIDGSASAGSDYTAVGGTLTWLDGDSAAKTIVVPIIDDTDDEADEDFGVTLSSPGGGATLGNETASVTIGDNDEPPPSGVVEFDGADEDGVLRLRINEDGTSASPAKGLLTLQVFRAEGSEGPASVAYTTVDGTATSPDDFAATSGELTWADGEDGGKSIVLSIVEDDAVEPDESFRVVLSDAQGAGLGQSLEAQIVIVANGTVEPAPSSAPAVIPANDWRGVFAMFGALLAAGWLALRRRV